VFFKLKQATLVAGHQVVGLPCFSDQQQGSDHGYRPCLPKMPSMARAVTI
jgi:hypothetical protein